MDKNIVKRQYIDTILAFKCIFNYKVLYVVFINLVMMSLKNKMILYMVKDMNDKYNKHKWFHYKVFTVLFALLCFYAMQLIQPIYVKASSSSTIIVDDSSALQQVINEAPAYSIIQLKEGIYEGPIAIKQALTLTSRDSDNVTIVNKSSEPTISIYAENVVIDKIQVKDIEMKEAPTILVSAHATKLSNLSITTNSDGIYAKAVNDGSIVNSQITWRNNKIHRSNKGNGIALYSASNWTVENNEIANMNDGIYLERVENVTISNNAVQNSRYGMHFMFVTNGQVNNNRGVSNVTGAMIMASTNINVFDNTFLKQVENLNSQGILLYQTDQLMIENNTIDGNRVGLYIEESTNSIIENNLIMNNFIGIQWLKSSQNLFRSNSIVGNVIDVQSVGAFDNNITHNYWDSFNGIDMSGDGYSDTSYAINPLFYGLIQKQAPFQIFFNSPGMDFLNRIYQVNPSTWLTDIAPKMRIDTVEQELDNINANKGDSLFISAVLLILSFLIIKKTRRKLK